MSGSMEPKIKVGSIVFVQKVKPEILKENDVITYASLEDSSILITHRLTAIEEKEGRTVFKTQGDANNSEDIAEVSPSQIKGKVIFSLPFLGYLSVWIRKPLGFGLLVILPALLIIISEILNIKKTIEKEVEKKYAKLEKHKKSPPANLLFIFFLIGVGFSQIKSTNAFFSDVMLVEGNTFTAARLDFSLSNIIFQPLKPAAIVIFVVPYKLKQD
jgi:signal peptidase